MEHVIKDDFASIYEVKLNNKNENCLRVYCIQSPDIFNFQIRTYKPIGECGKGKPRNMIANIRLSIKEIEEILDFMKSPIDLKETSEHLKSITKRN